MRRLFAAAAFVRLSADHARKKVCAIASQVLAFRECDTVRAVNEHTFEFSHRICEAYCVRAARLDFGPSPTGTTLAAREGASHTPSRVSISASDGRVSQNNSPINARHCPKKERCCDTSINAVGVSHDKVAPQVGIAKHSKWDSAASARAQRRLT